MLARRGQDPVTEAEIAQAARELLDKAESPDRPGRPSTRDGKVAGRTRATTKTPRWPPNPQRQPFQGYDVDEDDSEDGPLAEVIPLGVFDARQEATKWW